MGKRRYWTQDRDRPRYVDRLPKIGVSRLDKYAAALVAGNGAAIYAVIQFAAAHLNSRLPSLSNPLWFFVWGLLAGMACHLALYFLEIALHFAEDAHTEHGHVPPSERNTVRFCAFIVLATLLASLVLIVDGLFGIVAAFYHVNDVLPLHSGWPPPDTWTI